MSDEAKQLEARVAALEAAVAALQQRLSGQQAVDPNWLQKFIGSFKDDPGFEDVIRYGRELNVVDWPPEEQEPTP